MTTGLLISGNLHDIPGLTIVPPASHGGPDRCQLSPEDYRIRPGIPTKVTPHSTGGLWPQPVLPGAARPGRALEIFDMWRGKDRGGGEHVYSAAHIVVDFDGTIYCGADLVYHMAYHATAINPSAVGIEMCTHPDGSIQEATLDATARLIAALTWSGTPNSGLLSIPFQMHKGPYRNEPLRRLELGGKSFPGNDVVGVIGHREQTSQRGYGDPGNEIYARLAGLGCEGLDYNGEEDLIVGRRRQMALNALDAKAGLTNRPLTVDGVCGPASLMAMARNGFKRWRDVA